MFPSHLTSFISSPRPGHSTMYSTAPLHDVGCLLSPQQLTSVMVRHENDPPSTGQQLWCRSLVLLLTFCPKSNDCNERDGNYLDEHGTQKYTLCTCAKFEYWFLDALPNTLRGPSIRLLSHQSSAAIGWEGHCIFLSRLGSSWNRTNKQMALGDVRMILGVPSLKPSKVNGKLWCVEFNRYSSGSSLHACC